ncbi:hypothetical protein B0T26DRAFT_702521 [Lasiosphaeria miniovina]|uniref:Uncharacterized protein n=1 Tax=Lasiosphaeria miniovina TaxID=1954250 RepID=A0AA40AUS1_9PEZI|nr:uncharacterized protein B0T26DRAFT_702521 [Lasiosphaeria miniovina]KAK0722385.1 hypothetical protein B0T26DRAFT_702521 [Lasiosphaeria miniovina]
MLDYPYTESRGEEDCRKLKKAHSTSLFTGRNILNKFFFLLRSHGSWPASTTPSGGIRSAYRIADLGLREASNAMDFDLV